MKNNYLSFIVILGCLGGLVSCYPIVAPAHSANNSTVRGSSKPSQTLPKKKVPFTEPSYSGMQEPAIGGSTTSESGYGGISNETVNDVIQPKPSTPTVIKTASEVPGKQGFVFNPYTQNQVDVRGIPSGTKVRDPNDSNPAHIFKVP